MLSLWSATGFAQVDPWSLWDFLGSDSRIEYLVLVWLLLSEAIKSVTILIKKELIKILHKNFPLRENLRELTRWPWKQLAASPCAAPVNHSDFTISKASLKLRASLAMFCRTALILSIAAGTSSAAQHHSPAWQRSCWGAPVAQTEVASQEGGMESCR